ncbi:GDYXXLXY domain-containing protein [Phormidium tenue FACHB-886]|nr:GDYXXLXY domain-containing protein [Phormidium tenue FACHB-886]
MTHSLPPELPPQSKVLAPANRAPHPATPKLPGWRLWLPLALQTALILAIPTQAAYTLFTGKTVTLQTLPIDPYDLVRGYSQTLNYDISSRATLETLPGGDWFTQHELRTPARFYVILAAPTQTATPPQPWKPVRISGDRPTQLPANQIALQGQFNRSGITYGLETYYMPEDQRQQINTEINQIQRQAARTQSFVVDVKVDGNGNAVPVSLWLRDRNYQF